MKALSALLSRYVDASIQLKNDTVVAYQGTVNRFSDWLRRPAEARDLCDATVARWLRAVCESRSAATAAKHRRQLVMLWLWAWRKGHVRSPPRDVPVIRCPKRHPRAWTPGEVALILDACNRARPIPGWGPLRWRALTLTIYDSGERISPLLLIPTTAFHAGQRLLTVSAEHRKRGSEDQVYRLHPQTVAAILASLTPGQERLFPWPLHERGLWPAWKAILRNAGLPATSRDMFHKLRRTNYTLTFVALGREAARRNAGHSRDLTHLYLDETQLPGHPVCDAIIRP